MSTGQNFKAIDVLVPPWCVQNIKLRTANQTECITHTPSLIGCGAVVIQVEKSDRVS